MQEGQKKAGNELSWSALLDPLWESSSDLGAWTQESEMKNEIDLLNLKTKFVKYQFIFYKRIPYINVFKRCALIVGQHFALKSFFNYLDYRHEVFNLFSTKPLIEYYLDYRLMQVGWLKADDQTILSLHNRLVTHNPRIGITHDNNHWSLHIRQVKEADKGCYMCQINTSVMKKQVGCVDVHG